MNKDQQVNNVLAFLAILFGESDVWHKDIMSFTPDYIIEKFNRYINSLHYEAGWGIHPSYRNKIIKPYCDKWNIKTGDELIDIDEVK